MKTNNDDIPEEIRTLADEVTMRLDSKTLPQDIENAIFEAYRRGKASK